MKRKGLSRIITTLITILLVIVSISIIWMVVKSFAEESVENISMNKLTVDLKIENAHINENDTLVVSVKRGSDKSNLVKIKFIIDDGKNSDSFENSTTMKVQELDTFFFNSSLFKNILPDNAKTVSIVPVYKTSSGKEEVGSIVSVFELSPSETEIPEESEGNETENPPPEGEYWEDGWETPTGEDVLVVYNLDYTIDSNNDGTQDSLEIAQYYSDARDIKERNICGIHTSTKEVINLEEYDSERDATSKYENHIRQQIENCLEEEKTKYIVDYIVLVKGVPLKMKTSEEECSEYYYYEKKEKLSVDMAVAQLFQEHKYCREYLIYPPNDIDEDSFYFKSHRPNETLTYYRYRYPTYIVTRLDGYTISDVKSMVDRALLAEEKEDDPNPDCCWVLDQHIYKKLYAKSINRAYIYLNKLEEEVLPEYWPPHNKNPNYPSLTDPILYEWITTANCSVIGYVSWGIHAGMPDGYPVNTLDFQYEPGAILTTFESFNGYGFISPDQNKHGQIAEFIQEGASGGIGNVYEPYFSAIPGVDILFVNYLKGNTFGEAAYSSLWYANWRTVVVGDPLMRIRPYREPSS